MSTRLRLLHNVRNLCVSYSSQLNRSKTSNALRNARHLATQVSTSSKSDSSSLAEGAKKETNAPFIKDLFLGRFDTSILEFPEVCSNEELEELNQMVEHCERFFKEGIDSQSIDVNAKIPEETWQTLKDLGLLAQQIPVEYGGLALNATKFARIAEITALDASIAVSLAGHQSIGLKGILICGTDEQKQQYLPKLATGEHIAAFALTEPSSGSDAASIRTKATLSEDGKTYHLNGSKIWITNGGIAEVMTVFAKVSVTDPVTREVSDKVTAFIVERSFGGVSNGKPEDKLGIRGSNTCEVYFDNTPVPAENVLGEVGGGFKVAMNILNSGRFSMGSSAAGGLKYLMEMTVEHCTTRSQFGKKLAEFDLIKEKLARMAMTVYAMESMAYMTAGILDSHEKPDAAIEAAIVKVFSSEALWEYSSECLQIMGGMGYMKSYPFERYVRDARICMIFEGTNEILRLFIALTGIQYAGVELRQMVSKFRNPFNNMGFVTSQMLSRATQNFKNPKLSLKLYDHIHPKLGPNAEMLEKVVHRFRMSVEEQLSLYANKIVDEQQVVRRLADIAIDVYAMTATLSRASRSLSIGLKNADHEVALAISFCNFAAERANKHIDELKLGKFCNNDSNLMTVADTILKEKGYAASHPLDKNW